MYPDAWECIGARSHVVDWIRDGVPLVLSNNPSEFEIPNQSFTRHQSDFINKELTRLLLLDAIEPCNTKPKCVSPISVVPKKKNKNRLIIDLRALNDYCDPPKFVNEDIRAVKSVIQRTLPRLTSRTVFYRSRYTQTTETYWDLNGLTIIIGSLNCHSDSL